LRNLSGKNFVKSEGYNAKNFRVNHLKVLILSSEFPPIVGGISSYAYNLSRGLCRADVKIHVITFGSDYDFSDIPNLKALRLASFWNKKFIKIIPLFVCALWICIWEKPNNILAMVWTHEGIASFLIKKILGTKYFLMAHGSEVLKHKEKNIQQWLMKLIFENAKTICANSRFTRKLVVSLGFKTPNIIVAHPPISIPPTPSTADLDELNKKFDLNGKLVLLTVSRLVPRKGHAEVIKALAKLRSKYPNLIYVMTGEGPYIEILKKIAEEHDIQDRIIMPGFVSTRDLSLLYQRCDIYVSPSHEINNDIEGFGMSLAEASSFGKPVIAGKSGGVEDAVIDGETGLLVESPSVDFLVEGITRLLDDELLRLNLGNSGKEFVERELNIMVIRKKFLDILERKN
jgi:phosphatidylinositol alpha-1,6-mannosyltransferase